MIVDALGVNAGLDAEYDEVQDDVEVDEPPNEEAQKFYNFLKETNKPLFPGSPHSKLSMCARLIAQKSQFHVPEKALDLTTKMMLDSTPIPDGLPKSFYEAKQLVSKLGLGVKRIDCCVKGCMLFYDNEFGVKDGHLVECKFCQEPRYKGSKHCRSSRGKPVPRKALFYLPIIPRLQRMYASMQTAEKMTWHSQNYERRNNSGELRHPSDGLAWKHFDQKHPNFALEPRNVRLGLCSDGFTPHIQGSGTPYSCWPIIITPYNLPPDMCMSKPYMFLAAVIPGPNNPKVGIDIYLQPLIDDLKRLWNGVHTYDISRKQNFVMRAALMWTINDFPAYGMLSGWGTHGRLACPICMEDTDAFRLEHGGKTTWFGCTRRWLPDDHPFRRNKNAFIKGETENRGPPPNLTSEQVWNKVKKKPKVQIVGGVASKPSGYGQKHNWTKRSIFWDLPYWKDNLLRHNLDVMHIEKNFFDNIFNTVMNVKGKTKDNEKARKDMELYCRRKVLVDPNVKILVDRHDRYVISTFSKAFLPNRLATESITAVIEARYQKPWLSWGAIIAEGKNMANNKPRDEFWNLFKEKCTWKKEEDGDISKVFDSASSKRLSSMLSLARKKRGPNDENRPHWIGDGTWRELCKKWDLKEYQDKCKKNRDNRRSEKATTSVHSGGSVNAGTSSFRHKAQHGRFPTLLETFNYFHFDKGLPRDKRSESIDKAMKEFIEDFQSQQDSLPPSERVDPTTVDGLMINKLIEIAGGKNKGRVVGAGSNSSLYQKDPSGIFIDISLNSYGSTGRSSRRHDDPIYTEVEQLRAENAILKVQQEELVKKQEEMERRVVELVQKTMQEQQRQSRGDTSQHDPYDYDITPQYDDLGTSMVRSIMRQPNKRPRLEPQSVRSDHDEHHRPPHIPVGDRQMSSSMRPVFNAADTNAPHIPIGDRHVSSSTRPVFNAADTNAPHIPIGDRHVSSSTRRVYAADFNIPGGESFLKNYMDNASQGNRSSGGRSEFPQYYDD